MWPKVKNVVPRLSKVILLENPFSGSRRTGFFGYVYELQNAQIK
jgi:hypothetical protein